jgi:uncharacterized membrane protein
MFSVAQILFILAVPLGVICFEKKIKLIEWLSPVVFCYGVGILAGNLSFFSWNTSASKTLSEVSVLLAIPLLLLASDLTGWIRLARPTIISFISLIICVILVSILSGYYFRDYDPEVWKMAGMLAGVYIGGTANLTAIGKMLEIRDEAFITLNAVDVALGGFYLLFVMSVGVKLLTRFLLPFSGQAQNQHQAIELLHWKALAFDKKILHAGLLIILCGILIGVALLLSQGLTGGESPGVIILSLTVFSLLLSFHPKIRGFEGSQETGHYFLLVFCVAVGSLANISQMVSGHLWYFIFCSSVMFGSIVLHFLSCYFLKIDRDTAIITSMAGIFGPAFIAPMSDVLKNREILVAGITSGLVGIAVGNFAGLLVAWCLR